MSIEQTSRRPYEEPHACTKASGSESVERADGVDVDGVSAVGTGSVGRTCTCHCDDMDCVSCEQEDVAEYLVGRT